MGKYMLQVSYTPEGARGLIKEGASSRITYVTDLPPVSGQRSSRSTSPSAMTTRS